ncbi:hypothetical protein Tco_0597658 [Tanacetum coccineum]
MDVKDVEEWVVWMKPEAFYAQSMVFEEDTCVERKTCPFQLGTHVLLDEHLELLNKASLETAKEAFFERGDDHAVSDALKTCHSLYYFLRGNESLWRHPFSAQALIGFH